MNPIYKPDRSNIVKNNYRYVIGISNRVFRSIISDLITIIKDKTCKSLRTKPVNSTSPQDEYKLRRRFSPYFHKTWREEWSGTRDITYVIQRYKKKTQLTRATVCLNLPPLSAIYVSPWLKIFNAPNTSSVAVPVNNSENSNWQLLYDVLETISVRELRSMLTYW